MSSIPGAINASDYQLDEEQGTASPQIQPHIIISSRYSLRTRNNALAPVNCLPTEILVHIFSSLEEIDEPHHECPSDTSGCPIGWIRVTHVCRQWRCIAIDHPSLWTNILCDLGPKWTKAFLQRSQMASILFSYTMPNTPKYGTRMDVASEVSNHMHHMQELRISIRCGQDAMQLARSLATSAPVLEKVWLRSYRRHPAPALDTSMSGNEPLPLLPTNLFNRSAPRLRFLSIFSFRVPWSSLDFSSLVHLRIDILSRANTAGMEQTTAFGSELRGFGSVLSALSRMPVLEDLGLYYTLPHLSSDVTPHTKFSPHVTLSRLRKLCLVDDIVQCVVILNHITMPSTTRKAIKCTLDAVHGHGSEVILPWLTSQIGMSSFLHRSEIECWRTGFKIDIAISNGACTNAEQTPSRSLSPNQEDNNIHFSVVDLTTDGTYSVFQTICQALPLGHLDTLYIHVSPGWRNSPDWLMVLERCKILRCLSTGTLDSTFWTALTSPHDIRIDGRSLTYPLFPSFTSLTLLYWNFKRDAEQLGMLLELLRHRRGIAPLQKVDLTQCLVDSQIVEQIKSEVPDVIWDEGASFGSFRNSRLN
ncbi:hypothetical protein DENSPDRAFT_454479 [Dentipellis sp. KUC8613]|nr:hypothetical protein DENSPDRAFT_454479 [Dentipellis sp. KUC8613]